MASTEQQEERLPLLHQPLPHPEIVEAYACDGSVDIDGNPALKHSTGSWRACSSILGTEFCYCLANYGITKNLVTYLKTELHESNAVAASNVTLWQAAGFLTSLAGAILADSYWGRHRTIMISSSVCLAGMITLALSASLPHLSPTSPPHLTSPAKLVSAQETTFFLGLYMFALGSGGIRPCVSSFGADQFDATDPLERRNKGSFFNWYFFTINTGSVVSGTAIVWVQDHYGWALGFAVPTLFMAAALGNFAVASRLYRFQRTGGGSPLVRVCQVIVAAVCKFDLELPSDESLLYETADGGLGSKGFVKPERSADLKFLDKAAIVRPEDELATVRNPWRLCTVTQVEELKILVRMLPIWATIVFFYAVSAQASSTFVEQGMAMDNRVGTLAVPPASLSTFDVLTIIALVPLYDRAFVPAMRRLTGEERGVPDLHRIAAGLVMPVLVMASAALVETKRLEIAGASGRPMSILWQAPQYFLVGVGEVLTTIGQLEFFYGQAPAAMRSVCMALGLLAVAAGGFLSSVILAAVASATARGGRPGWIPDDLNEGHLDRFFWLMAGLGCLNLAAFACCATRYNSRKLA